MLTHSHFDAQCWTLRFGLEADDCHRGPGQSGTDIGFKAQQIHVELPVAPVKAPHPDAEALAVLTIVRPWIGSSLQVTRGVSQEFQDGVFRLFRIEVGPVHKYLKPRSQGSVPVLSYSAGFDSTAASALFPEFPHVHHRRVSHPAVPDPGTYRADAIESLVTAAGDRGRDVYITRTDFEHIVDPYPSLPHWFGFAVGPLLLSEHLDAGALVLGGTLETRYMDMGRRWTGPPPTESGIDPLPRLVGMPVMRPLVGISEIGTMELTLKSDLKNFARSCVAGSVEDACHRCSKCIRKDLIRAVITGDATGARSIPDDAPGWGPFAADPPFYMQAQYEWVIARLPREDWPGGLSRLATKLPRASLERTEWMGRAYSPAVDSAIPPQWRELSRQRIAERLGWMQELDVDHMQAWDRT